MRPRSAGLAPGRSWTAELQASEIPWDSPYFRDRIGARRCQVRPIIAEFGTRTRGFVKAGSKSAARLRSIGFRAPMADGASMRSGGLPGDMPLKTRFIEDLQADGNVTDFFLVQMKEVRLKRSGEPYLSLVLSDRTGRLGAKMWDGIEDVVNTFESGDFIKVAGLIQIYRGKPQLTIQRLRIADDSEVRISDYLPHTKKDVDEMFASLKARAAAFDNADLKRLLEAFLDDEDIAERFKRAPAAKSLHHAFIGGLLEHVASLMRLAELVGGHYDFIDVELVQTGVVLHDLGKIYELRYERTFQYTDEGQLLGHIPIVLRMLDRKCAELPAFPPKLKTLVEHLILSHHGKYEFGSPKLPSFPEALLLHYLDDVDSKLESMRASISAYRVEENGWTPYNPSLERSLLDKERFLAERRTVAPGAAGEAGPQAPREPPASPKRSNRPQNNPPRPRSLFGEQLQTALDKRGE